MLMKTVGDMLTEVEKRKELNKRRYEELVKQYDKVSHVDGWFIVQKGDMCGVVTYEDGEKSEILLDSVESINKMGTYPKQKDNLFFVRKNGKWGYVNNLGKEIVPCVYDDEDYLDNLRTMAYNVRSFLYYGSVDEPIDSYVDVEDENVYRVLIHLLKNRYEIEKTKDDKLSSDFIYDEGYVVKSIIESVKKTQTESDVSKAGMAALQKFYNENLAVEELNSGEN